MRARASRSGQCVSRFCAGLAVGQLPSDEFVKRLPVVAELVLLPLQFKLVLLLLGGGPSPQVRGKQIGYSIQ